MYNDSIRMREPYNRCDVAALQIYLRRKDDRRIIAVSGAIVALQSR
jgi:hypothetical protein